MVIQRWQTLLLLIAVVLMGCLNFVPVARIPGEAGAAEPFFTTDAPVLMIVSILVAVLLFISIFMFKNLKQQMKVTILSILLMCVLLVGGIFVLFRTAPDAEIEWAGATLLLCCSVILALAAWRLMKKDYRLLRSADRLR